MRPVLFCGDPHGEFEQVIESAERLQALAVVLLGDLEPRRPLAEELHELNRSRIPWYFIAGNHDSDSESIAERIWCADVEPHNIHGRAVMLSCGLRLAGLAGVFRKSIWYPPTMAPTWRSRAEHARRTPRHDRWGGTLPPRKHLSSIYPDEVARLQGLRADILVSHEAGGYHPHGFSMLDDITRRVGARWAIHGHHHDSLDSSAHWTRQGFCSFGVGLRGVLALWPDGERARWETVHEGVQTSRDGT